MVEQGGFDARLRTAEDMDFFQRIARTGTAFLAVPEPLALYHMRRGSLSTDARAMLADGTGVIERAFAIDPRVVHPSSVTPPAPIQKRDRRKWRRARTRCGAPRSMSARAATARAC